jgi:hypothetical protein
MSGDGRDELERFKRDISLPAFAASRGYEVDRRESSRASVVMRNPATDDKIVVARSAGDEHWTYFSIRDSTDHGSIIDFMQRRERLSLGQVRKELRGWVGGASARTSAGRGEPLVLVEPRRSDRAAVAAAYERAIAADNSLYLNSRGIRPEILRDPRFAGTFRVDERGNLLFAHSDAAGDLCGYEVKNRGFTGFAPGGMKALWHSAALAGDEKLVLTESAIDAISYHQLAPDRTARYASTGGSISTHQRGLIARDIEKMPGVATVVLAFDADEGGDKLATEVEALVPGARFVRHSPPKTPKGKDWNDVLKFKEQAFIRSQNRRRPAG